MENQQPPQDAKHLSLYALRRNLGILGISLPFILVLGNWLIFKDSALKSSISHYYYTGMSVYFTGILWAFGLFLYAYKGYRKKKGELISDNFLSNLAGIAAIVTALFPTGKCELVTIGCLEAVNGHSCKLFNTIHLIAAGVFLIAMGYMSLFKFTKSESDLLYKHHKRITYRVAGIVVWVCIAFLLTEFIIDKHFTPWDVFIAEAVALFFFGTAWLVKSQAMDPLMARLVAKLMGIQKETLMTKKLAE